METFPYKQDLDAIERRKQIQSFGIVKGEDLSKFVKKSQTPPKFKINSQDEIDEYEDENVAAYEVKKYKLIEDNKKEETQGDIYIPPSKRNVKTSIKIINIPQNIQSKKALEVFFNNTLDEYPISVNLILDQDSKESKGYAYVTYDSLQQAQSAIKKIDGFVVEELILGAEMAKKQFI